MNFYSLGLIVHHKTTVDEFQLAIGNKGAHQGGCLGIYVFPKALEEALLNIGKLAIGVECKLMNHREEDVSHAGPLNVLF